jgi:hypothetical protein
MSLIKIKDSATPTSLKKEKYLVRDIGAFMMPNKIQL